MPEKAEFSKDTESRLISWIEKETGLSFPDVHLGTILSAASSRCAESGLRAHEFLDWVEADANARNGFLNDIVIGETYFFRDEKHFKILLEDILPALMSAKDRANLWSVTCASGEEAISLGICADYARRLVKPSFEFSVLATDINQHGLKTLSSGLYGQASFRTDGKIFQEILDRYGEPEAGGWRVSPELLRHIHAEHFNVLKSQLPARESKDVVFFRNTLVYMKPEQKKLAIDRIVSCLAADGYLFVSSPEVPTVQHPDLRIVESGGTYFFRKESSSHREAPPPEHNPSAIKPKLAAFSRPAEDILPPSKAERKTRPALAQASAQGKVEGQSEAEPQGRTEGPAGIKRRVNQAGLLRIVEFAAFKAGRLSEKPKVSAEEQSAAEALSDTISAWARPDLRKSMAAIEAFEKVTGESFISLYLRAEQERRAGRERESVDLLERARLYNPDFWPSAFSAGMIYARAENDRCLELLEESVDRIESGSFPHSDVFLEDFDAGYFMRMAQNMIVKYKKRKG
jgi:chemotaxis methyl-accepting protein methylase